MPFTKTPSGLVLPRFPQRIIKTRSGKEKSVEYKIVAGSLKATNDSLGIVEGYLNTIGNIDYGNDRTMPGAFKRTLDLSYKRKNANGDQFLWPYLYNHSVDVLPPGGIFDAEEDKKGLFIKAQLNLDYQLGRDMYSSYKFGSLKKQSMGYLAHQTEYTREDGQLVRDLLEVEILEGSGVIFPMNDESDVTDVKSAGRFWQGVSLKSASGKTTWPLAPDDTKWDGGQATKDIEAWADGDWSKVAQCFFWVASSPPKTLDDCKLPFVAKVNGKMQAVPRGIIACTGSHGLDAVDIPDADIPGVKKKIASYYKKMKMTPPWEDSDSGKRGRRSMDKKDFNDLYQAALAADCLEDWGDLINTLTQTMIQIFGMGDSPEPDMTDALSQFGEAVMAWNAKAIECGLSDYISDQGYCTSYGSSPYVPYSLQVGYMSRNNPTLARKDRKAGASFSQANADAIHGHVAALHDMADEQSKAMHDAADGLLEALQGLGAPSDPSYRQQGTTADDEKSFRRARRSGRKAGAEYSADNLQMLGEHIGDLHDVADTIHQMAEDLAENTGAQTYSDSDGTPDDASETDKNKANSRLDALGRKHSPAAGTAVDDGDVHTALSRLNNLTIVK